MTVTEAAAAISVAHAGRLRGRLRVPPDKSITHRALLLAAVGEGESRVQDGSDALDPRSTAACLRALGVHVERSTHPPDPADRRDPRTASGRVDWLVRSPGWTDWRAPSGDLDCGNSGTTLRLLAGLLAGLPIAVTLDGDDSLRSRPVRRIVEPLRAMGATLRGANGDARPPLRVEGRRPLESITWTTPVPSAQVKSAILLAGLAATGRTIVREALATRDHTERMLRARGVPVVSEEDPQDGSWTIAVEGGSGVTTCDEVVPGDPSAAAFWLVAGAAHPDAELLLEGVGLNPTRRAALDLLRAMGAQVEERPSAVAGPGPASSRAEGRGVASEGGGAVGEPVADLVVRSSSLEGIELGPDEVARAIDEIPILALAAACARGRTRIRGAGELRHKESDRLVGIVEGLAALGAHVELEGDDLIIQGGAGRPGFGLRGASVRSRADHRLAMTFAIAGLIASGTTTLEGAAAAGVSYPAFFDHLEGVRA